MMVIFFSVKVLKKKFIIKEKKVAYVSREKEALAMTNHPFLVKLYFTFQDKENLCILSLHFVYDLPWIKDFRKVFSHPGDVSFSEMRK